MCTYAFFLDVAMDRNDLEKCLLFRSVCKDWMKTVHEIGHPTVTIKHATHESLTILHSIFDSPQLRIKRLTQNLEVFRNRKYMSVSLKMIPTRHLAPLANVPELHFLACDMLSSVREIKDVHTLSLIDCGRIYDLSCLTYIRTLNLAECTWLHELGFLSDISSTLRELDISLTKVTNIYPISLCDLEWLDIGGLEVEDISALVGIPRVEMNCCRRVTNVSPLQYAKELDLGYCTAVEGLASLKDVGKIQLRGFNGLIPLSLLSQAYPSLNIRCDEFKAVPGFLHVKEFFGIIGDNC